MEANENNMKLKELLEDLNYEILNAGLAGLETEISSVVLDILPHAGGFLFASGLGNVDVGGAGGGHARHGEERQQNGQTELDHCSSPFAKR